MTTRRWVDWVNVMLGAWLISSPWRLTTGAAGDGPAAWSSWSVGAGIVALAFFSMYKPAVWGYAVGVVLGVWLAASPWTLGFASASAAAANAVIIGLLVIGYALWAMRIGVTSGDAAAYDVYQRRPA
jgi:SPW repeat